MSLKKISKCDNFECPKQKLVFDSYQSVDKHKHTISEHFFNNSISLIIPGHVDKQHIKQATSAIEQQPFYKVDNLPLSKLIDVEFIEAFVRRGNMHIISYDTHIDTSALCVALHPPGQLVLNMSKDIYEQLGLEGQPSCFNKKTRSRYVVTIDLLQPSFHPSKKNYMRVKWCLTNRLDLNVSCLVTWVPFDGTICPSSIGSYFSSCGFGAVECKQKRVKRRLERLTVPIVDGQNPDPVDGSCGYTEFYEWLGFLACGCEPCEPDGFTTTYSCPEPIMDVAGDAWLIKVSGMCTPHSVLQTIDHLRKLITVNNLPWISLNAHGFADSPVTLYGREHGYYTNGDNLLTLVLFPDNYCWTYAAYGTNDRIA